MCRQHTSRRRNTRSCPATYRRSTCSTRLCWSTGPVNPLTPAVARTPKPALVAAEHFLVKRRRVHGLIDAVELAVGRDLVCVRAGRAGYGSPWPGTVVGGL